MNKLSKRLEVVANFVDENDKSVIDIGCDHGLLSIFLANKYKKLNIIASDVNKNALESARGNISKYNLEDRIDVRLGDGLSVIENNDNIDSIVIAGMGANNITGFLKSDVDKLVNVNKIIIQSNTDIYLLRKTVTSLGYYIDDEELVLDRGKIYTIIKFIKGKRRYSYKELYLGPILMKKNSDLFRDKCKMEYDNLVDIINNIKGHYIYKIKLRRDINILKNIT